MPFRKRVSSRSKPPAWCKICPGEQRVTNAWCLRDDSSILSALLLFASFSNSSAMSEKLAKVRTSIRKLREIVKSLGKSSKVRENLRILSKIVESPESHRKCGEIIECPEKSSKVRENHRKSPKSSKVVKSPSKSGKPSKVREIVESPKK